MALSTRLVQAARAIMGETVYETRAIESSSIVHTEVDDPDIERLRERQGGQIQTPTIPQLRWFQADLEIAQILADRGDLSQVGKLWRAMRRDGLISGLLRTRTSGLVALPKQWRGNQAQIDALKAENATRSLFDEMFPPAEVALMAADGIGVGVGIAELVPVTGRPHPVMVRLDPEYLRYLPQLGGWFFMSNAGLIKVEPGQGRWILHVPGGRMNPWQNGDWHTLGRAFIDKEHAFLHRANYSGKLANPARVAHAPKGGSEEQRQGFLARLIAWGINTVFELPPGWDVKLLESNGRGWEVFKQQGDDANLEIMITLAGQVVTITGGAGFSNADIHETIRADLIKQTADSLAYTLNTQGIAPWVLQQYGLAGMSDMARVSWDIRPPVDRKVEAETLKLTGEAIMGCAQTLAEFDKALDVDEVLSRAGIPVKPGAPEIAPPSTTVEKSNDSESKD